MLLFLEKVAKGTQSLALSILIVALVVSIALLPRLGQLTATSAVFNISEVTRFLDHDKSNSVSYLIQGNSRYL